MVKWFIRHQWKESKRSSIWQKKVAMNIFLGFMIFILLLYVLALGLFIDKILEELYPDRSPIDVFNGYILYYFGVDLFIRYFMQNLPTLHVETYLHLPIKKSKIVHFVIMKTGTNLLNYIPLLVFIPFAIKVIGAEYSAGIAWVWIVSIITLIFTNNFLVTYMKRQLVAKPNIVGIFGLVVLSLILLDYFNVFSFSIGSTYIFKTLLEQPIIIIVPFLLLFVVYLINYRFLRARLYPEEISIKKDKKTHAISNIEYLKTLGISGQILSLDIKLFLRHKRTKSILYMLPVFLLYGFFFYPQEIYINMYGMLIFVGVFMSGGLMFNYTNYAFCWESNYFDAILANNIDIKRYLLIKYYISMIICTVCFILTIPYLFFGLHILYINIATFLYNAGCLSLMLLYMATYNKKRMDLSRGAAFNYQGVGVSNWIAMLPAFLLPIIIYVPFWLAGIPNGGLVAIGALGVIGLIFHKQIVERIFANFIKRKYIMADGFRSSE